MGLKPRQKGSITRCGAALNGCTSPKHRDQGKGRGEGEAGMGLKQNIIKTRGWIAPLLIDCDKAGAEGTARAVPQDFYASRSRAASGSFLERAAAAAAVKHSCPFPLPFVSQMISKFPSNPYDCLILFKASNKQPQPKATCVGESAQASHSGCARSC